MNFAPAIHRGQLKVGTSVWKIMRDKRNCPTEVKEWVLRSISGTDNHLLGFDNPNDQAKEGVYRDHYNDDWFTTPEEAQTIANAIFKQHLNMARERVAELEARQNKFV